jgi:hypothetical protein
MGDTYDHLTDAEKLYVRQHPYNAYCISQAREIATRETIHRFGHNGHNDSSDAFRHCYWSALMSRDIGPAEAKVFSDLHEASPLNPAADKAMDLHNNAVGMEIGKMGGSDMGLADKCHEASRSGRLMFIR